MTGDEHDGTSKAPGAGDREDFRGEPVIGFADAAAWERWLDTHHKDAPGVWLKLTKKGCAEPSVGYSDALDSALCFGWIDGQKRAYDAEHWLQRFAPRTRRSRWSAINCGRVEVLDAAGRMRPAGRGAVELARADGRWDAAYAGPASAQLPPDLRSALDAEPRAAALFAVLDSANRFSVVHRVEEARRPETRSARIAAFVTMLANGETPHPMTKSAAKAAAALGFTEDR